MHRKTLLLFATFLFATGLSAQYGDAYHAPDHIRLNQMAYDRGQKIMDDHYARLGSSGIQTSGFNMDNAALRAWAEDVAANWKKAKEESQKQDHANWSAYYQLEKYAVQNNLRPGRETWDLLWKMAEEKGMSAKFYNKHMRHWAVKKWTAQEIAEENQRQQEAAKKNAEKFRKDWEDGWAKTQATSDEFDRAMEAYKKKYNIHDEAPAGNSQQISVADQETVTGLSSSYAFRDPTAFEAYKKKLSPEYERNNSTGLSNLTGSMNFVSQGPRFAAIYFQAPFQYYEQNMQALSVELSEKDYTQFDQYLRFAKLNFAEGSDIYSIITEGLKLLQKPSAQMGEKKELSMSLFEKAREHSARHIDFGSYLLLDMAIALDPSNLTIRKERYLTGTALGKKNTSALDELSL